MKLREETKTEMYNRFQRKSNQKLSAVSVARTVEAPQRNFEEFLIEAGRELGRRATVSAITSTRMTILESNGISRALRAGRADPRATNSFSYWLSSNLDRYRCSGMVMDIDQEQPLVLKGRNNNRLAFNLVSTDESIEQRERAEKLVAERFGDLPKLKPFDEHITWASMHLGRLSASEIENPSQLLPNIEMPQSIALNGLSVFVDGCALKHS